MPLDRQRLGKVSAIQTLTAHNVPIHAVIDVGVNYASPDLIEALPKVPHLLFEPVIEYGPHIAYAYRDIEHQLYHYALSDSDGTTRLRVLDLGGGDAISHSFIAEDETKGLSAFSADAAKDLEQKNLLRETRMVSLDSFFANEYRGTVQSDFLLKIDVDGVEEAILRGAREMMGRCSVVIVETAPSTLATRMNLIMEQGFVLWDILEPYYLRERLMQVDIVMVRKDYNATADTLTNSRGFSYDHWHTIG